MASKGITRANQDSAGGALIVGGQDFVNVEGDLWIVKGDSVGSHGLPPHDSATMAAGVGWLKVGGIEAVIEGKAATCGHLATGSSNMKVSE